MLSKKYADKLRSIFILKFYLKFQDEKKYILKNKLAWKIMTISVELPQIFFKKCQKAPELNSVVLLELWASLWFQAGSLYTYFFGFPTLFIGANETNRKHSSYSNSCCLVYKIRSPTIQDSDSKNSKLQ